MKRLVRIAGLFIFLVTIMLNAKSQQIHKWEVYPMKIHFFI